MRKIAVAIPAHNAADTIGRLISRVAEFVPSENIFVVDDGSTDKTELVARQHGVWVLRHAVRKGKGSSLRDASQKILLENYDSIITLDSDLQHDPSEIPSFIQASDSFDVVVGKRDVSAGHMPIHRFLSNSITSKLISLRTGAKIEDSQCGYRLYRAEVLKKVDSTRKHYDYESDVLIKAVLAGFSVGFIPVKTIYNDSESRINVLDILRFASVYFRSFAETHVKNRAA